METTLEISKEILDGLMRDNIGVTDLGSEVLIDKGRLATANTCYRSCAHTLCFCIRRD